MTHKKRKVSIIIIYHLAKNVRAHKVFDSLSQRSRYTQINRNGVKERERERKGEGTCPRDFLGKRPRELSDLMVAW